MEVHQYHSNITQKMHGASRNYSYVFDVSGIPKLRRLSLLEYLLGMHGGIPKLERLTLLDILSSSSIAHLKTPFIHNSS